MGIFSFSEKEILAFFLVLMRMSAFVVSWPVFGIQKVPAPVKILFALVMSLVIFPVISWKQISVDLESLHIIWLVGREIFIGVAFGFLARIFFFAISIAGQIMSTTLGLSSSQLFNPAMGEQTSSLEQFEIALATLFFLFFQGHLIFISGLVESFQFLPLSMKGIQLQSGIHFSEMVSSVMLIGFKLSAPVLVSIFFMNISMAIIGRTVPQINVLITSLPVNILVGFIVLIFSMPMLVWQFKDVLNVSIEQVFGLMKTF
ncbi:MAG: flagellar biosynthetic protein FliR [Bdellovibrio sp.]|nr:MAG: flagellar biosynthetic protein FliR [Bdellovibrio sp.]